MIPKISRRRERRLQTAALLRLVHLLEDIRDEVPITSPEGRRMVAEMRQAFNDPTLNHEPGSVNGQA